MKNNFKLFAMSLAISGTLISSTLAMDESGLDFPLPPPPAADQSLAIVEADQGALVPLLTALNIFEAANRTLSDDEMMANYGYAADQMAQFNELEARKFAFTGTTGLGTTVFKTLGRGLLSLTSAGAEFYQQIDPILAALKVDSVTTLLMRIQKDPKIIEMLINKHIQNKAQQHLLCVHISEICKPVWGTIGLADFRNAAEKTAQANGYPTILHSLLGLKVEDVIPADVRNQGMDAAGAYLQQKVVGLAGIFGVAPKLMVEKTGQLAAGMLFGEKNLSTVVLKSLIQPKE